MTSLVQQIGKNLRRIAGEPEGTEQRAWLFHVRELIDSALIEIALGRTSVRGQVSANGHVSAATNGISEPGMESDPKL